MKPLISIIIPTYNRACFIGETLESIISQTYRNWECVVIDDGSNDYTSELMEFYREVDERIKYFPRPSWKPKGANACRNYGFQKSKGAYIQYMDSDDILDVNKISAQLLEADQEQSSLLIGKWGGFYNRKDLVTRFKYNYHCYKSFATPIDLLNTMGWFGEFLPVHVYLTPRKTIEKTNGWLESLEINQDAEFFSRIILLSDSVKFCPTSIAYYRYNSDFNVSKINSKRKVNEALRSWGIIETNFRTFTNREGAYVKNAKYQLKKKLERQFPELLSNNKDFLKGGIDYSKWYFVLWIRFLLRK